MQQKSYQKLELARQCAPSPTTAADDYSKRRCIECNRTLRSRPKDRSGKARCRRDINNKKGRRQILLSASG